jgi:hypothetical protein
VVGAVVAGGAVVGVAVAGAVVVGVATTLAPLGRVTGGDEFTDDTVKDSWAPVAEMVSAERYWPITVAVKEALWPCWVTENV